MNPALRKLTAASYVVSAALIVWAVGATLFMIPIWCSDLGIADPPPNLKPEEAGAAVVGSIIGGGVVLAVRALVGLVIFLQGMLGIGLALAGRATARGRRSGRLLHLAWAILALLVELPLFVLTGFSGLHTMTGGLVVVSFLTAAYAFAILSLEPLLFATDSARRGGPVKSRKLVADDLA